MAMLLSGSSALFAADGTVNFKGTVTNATCEVMTPSLVYEGWTNALRWKNPYQNISIQSAAINLQFDCGELTSAPGIKFTAQTGIVMGNDESFLKTTGSASGVAIRLNRLNFGDSTTNPAFNPKSIFLLDGETYSTMKSTDGLYYFGIRAQLVGLEPYQDSFNGTFEAIVGYDLVYI